MTDSITARLAALPQTSTHDLRALWTELYDKPAPAFSRAYLVSRLAYRLQELHFGGVKPATRARLDALADGLDPKQARKRAPARLLAGTRLCREWQGTEHTVTVLPDGFDYQGRRYQSLSAIARTITGTRWNGPLFFGLRTPGGGK
jgi:hypothetical protein